jgi:uncharacterized protein
MGRAPRALGWLAGRLAAGCLALLLCLPVFRAAATELPVPPLSGRVVDPAGLLQANTRQQLETRLAALEQRKGAQVAVLLVPTTQPESIEEYAVRVFAAWELGRRGVDDGVLLVLARDDRRLRIEVGYGLEGVIPDAVAKRIIAEHVVPLLRQGDLDSGLLAGVTQIARLIDGEPLPAPAPRAPRGAAAASGGWLADPASWLFWGLVAVSFAGRLLRALFGRLLAALLVAACTAVLAGILLGAWWLGLLIGFGVFLLVLLGGGLPGFGGRGYGGGRGGWGGGGFSGGGGRSGGGGASGGW